MFLGHWHFLGSKATAPEILKGLDTIKIMLGVIWWLKWLSAERTFATVLHSIGFILKGHSNWPAAVIWQYARKGVILRLGVLNRIAKLQLQLPFPNEVCCSYCLARSLAMPGGPTCAGLGVGCPWLQHKGRHIGLLPLQLTALCQTQAIPSKSWDLGHWSWHHC